MNIVIAFPGKKIRPPESIWIDEYIKRTSAYAKVSIHYLPEPKDKLKLPAIAPILKDSPVLFSLDVNGKSYSTEKFSDVLHRQTSKKICFLIGASYGLSTEVIEASHFTLSLSSMTLPHRLALVILAEQLYRATSFAHGHPYHHKD